jgi:hypothetical protein
MSSSMQGQLKKIWIGIYEVFTGKKCSLGQQLEPFPGTSAVGLFT